MKIKILGGNVDKLQSLITRWCKKGAQVVYAVNDTHVEIDPHDYAELTTRLTSSGIAWKKA